MNIMICQQQNVKSFEQCVKV